MRRVQLMAARRSRTASKSQHRRTASRVWRDTEEEVAEQGGAVHTPSSQATGDEGIARFHRSQVTTTSCSWSKCSKPSFVNASLGREVDAETARRATHWPDACQYRSFFKRRNGGGLVEPVCMRDKVGPKATLVYGSLSYRLVPFQDDTLILKTRPTELRVAPSALPRAPCGHGRCS